MTAMHKTVNQLRDLRGQVQVMNHKYAGVSTWDPVRSGAEELIKKLTAIEEALVQTKVKSTEGDLNFPTMLDEQLWYLSFAVDGGDAAPTAAEVETFEMLSKKIGEQLSKWDNVLSVDLNGINKAAEKAKIPLIDSRGQ